MLYNVCGDVVVGGGNGGGVGGGDVDGGGSGGVCYGGCVLTVDTPEAVPDL